MSARDILLSVRDLEKHYKLNKFGAAQTVKALDGVTFDLLRGETLGLVGESGCGKTTCGRSILQLIKPTAGTVEFEGRDITKLSSRESRQLYREMQIIFQDCYSSLNPRRTVEQTLCEPLLYHRLVEPRQVKERARELLDIVGLSSDHLSRYPHEFSGGQRQRIGIARALSVNPKFIVLDEPISALDVSIQAQIINLLDDLQKEFNLTYLFISHDLKVVRHIADRVAIMYLGKIVETGPKKEIYENPQHPYTQALLSAVPVADPEVKRVRTILRGDVPDPTNPPQGCRFHTRCLQKVDICSSKEPELKMTTDKHLVSCHFATNLCK